MPSAAEAPSREAERIASIIKMQALLFGDSSEYGELLDFVEDRRPAKIERILSILGAQEILLASGLFLRGARARRAAEEIPGLVAYVRGLLEAEAAPKRRLEVLPRNLGRSFAAKLWGLPLFGDYRPARPPERGILLVYGSPDRDGRSASVEAARLGLGERLEYRGSGLLFGSAGPWLSLSALASDAPPPPRSEREAREERSFSRYTIYLDREARPRSLGSRLADPYEYLYPYLFYEGPAAASNLARFLSDLLSGILHVPLREAEKIAEAFSGRLP